ncbi:MAG: HAMP domain-containing protein [Bauldia sp.]|nr:HAMP domain-containing protein [Bauldia sp.]
MSILPRTLGGQLLALLLTALGASLLVSLVLSTTERADAVREADRTGLFETIVSVVRVLQDSPPDLRAALARAASTPRIRVWVSDESAVPPGASAPVRWPPDFERALEVRLPEPPRIALVDPAEVPIGQPRFVPRGQPVTASGNDVVVSVPFRDAGWVNAQTLILRQPVRWAWPVILSTTIMALAILAIVALTTRRAVKPLEALAAQADALGRGTAGPPIPEEGPEEVRVVTKAFNRMQERLGRFVADRTRMIAAIGHDLRTPITSLRLRAELLDDEEARGRMLATLDDMQKMVEATLAFAREEASAEEPRAVDLAALVASVVDDQADLGRAVTFAEAGRFPYRCRPTALKRALGNLIANAVQYGERARVTLSETPASPVIAVDDDGPGIPAERMDDVFQPFVRLEESRSRATGGVGLGLSIARSIVLAHGGELVLANRPGGGLRAEIRLPRADGEGRADSHET